MYSRILVPVDGSATSNKALVVALQIARDGGGRVRLVHALDELVYLSGYEYSPDAINMAREQARRVLGDAMAIAQSAGIPAEQELIETPRMRLGDSVARQAREWNADLIVVGTHGRRGVGRVLLGSGAEQIIRCAPVPVLVIRGDDAAAKNET
jgi:nucleotide-binding universal stress UspA family protein